jgi:hypothetical protein
VTRLQVWSNEIVEIAEVTEVAEVTNVIKVAEVMDRERLAALTEAVEVAKMWV